MDLVLEELVRIYGVYTYDWMSFKITRENPLTYHHLLKEADGGKKLICNGAPLTKLAHQYLNQIEQDDQIIYEKINRRLEKINDSGYAPTKDDLKYISKLLHRYERNHERELRKRIKNGPYNPKILREVSSGRDLFNPTNIRIAMQRGINPIGFPTKRMHKCQHKRKNSFKYYVEE